MVVRQALLALAIALLASCSRPVPSPLDAIATRLSTGKHKADCHGTGFHGEFPQKDFDYCEWDARAGETLTGNTLKRQLIAVQWTRQAADSLVALEFVDSLAASLAPKGFTSEPCPHQEWGTGAGAGMRWESPSQFIVLHWYSRNTRPTQVNVTWMLRPQFESGTC